MLKHAFVICAYKESKYLEACIVSLLNQTVKSKLMIASSTPSQYIDDLSKKYGVECYYREGQSDIKDDWNYACKIADAEWVTIAHQDDIYDARYAELMLKSIADCDEAIIAYCGYRALVGDRVVNNINCRIRHFLCIPMRSPRLSNNLFWKRLVLSMGNSICCPTVAYHKSVIKEDVFTSDMKFNIDWDTFLKFANMNGRFIYVDEPLVYYRIHEEATTMSFINNNNRAVEDKAMFCKFWPSFLVNIILLFYKRAGSEYIDADTKSK